MNASTRPLAMVTGASSGIGLGLALECARNGFDLIVAADRDLDDAMEEVRGAGAAVEAVRGDLATPDGVDELCAKVAGCEVAALIANAGHGLGRGFLARDVARIGFKAMMNGDGDVVAGMKNKIQSAIASVTPSAALAEQHRKMAEPGTAKQ